MPTTEHSPTPWHIDPSTEIHAARGGYVGDALFDYDAERIIACVNACASFAEPETDLSRGVDHLQRIASDETAHDSARHAANAALAAFGCDTVEIHDEYPG